MPSTASRGPGRPPAANSADTRDRILRTARAVFGELGYEAATFQEIADRADLTRPAINHYFPNKRVLYREVVEKTNAVVIAAGVERAKRQKDLTGRIREFMRTAVGAQERDRSASAFLVISLLESQRHPELRRDGNESLQATRGFLDWVLRDAVKTGEVHADIDVDAVTEALAAMLWGVGFYAGFVATGERLAAVTDEFLRLVHCLEVRTA